MLKKGLLFILLLLIICVLFFHNNKDDNKEKKITVSEVTHSVFYTPLYVALEKGFFKEEGIDINLVLTSGADKVSASVISGDAQIGFAGAESAIYVYKNGEKDYLQIFSGLTKKDGQFLVSRNKSFKIEDLKGKEVLVGRKGGMPSLNFINALKNANISINDVKLNYSIDFASLSGAFIGGTGDFVNLFEPNALKLEKEGYGQVVQSIGTLSGDMPYTTFYAKKSYINNNKDTITAFTKAINKALEYTNNTTSSTLAKDILKQFPDTSLNDLTDSIQRYKDNDTWLENGFVSEELLINLENLMIDNKLIDDYVPYKELIKYYG